MAGHLGAIEALADKLCLRPVGKRCLARSGFRHVTFIRAAEETQKPPNPHVGTTSSAVQV